MSARHQIDVAPRTGAARFAAAAAALAAVFALAACAPAVDAPAAAASAPPPRAEVGVVTVAPGPVALVTELPGRAEASRVAQVRARAAGILQQRTFREGSEVRAGQVLFQIDPSPYRAALASAQAALARAEANLVQARAQATRYKPLLDVHAISEQEYVAAFAAHKQAEADVAAGRAAVQTAQINLGHATVVAPIAGRIGRALVTEGALVGQGEATHLALVQQIDPIYVNFTQPVADVLRLRSAIARGTLTRAGGPAERTAAAVRERPGRSVPESTPVRIVLEDGSVHPQAGRLLFSDLSVDPGSGQITLRAEVPNPRGDLLPGMYVRARLEQAAASDAILLPQQAVQRSSQGDNVKVVAPDGTVGTRRVSVGGAKDGQWVVLDGLRAGEQVIVDGFQKLQPNAPVRPVPWQRAASAATSTPAASALPPAPAASPLPPAPAASALLPTPASSAPLARARSALPLAQAASATVPH